MAEIFSSTIPAPTPTPTPTPQPTRAEPKSRRQLSTIQGQANQEKALEKETGSLMVEDRRGWW